MKKLILHWVIVVLSRGGIIKATKEAIRFFCHWLVERTNIQFVFKGEQSPKGRRGKPSVLFISTFGGDSSRYRAAHPMEQLRLNGVDCNMKSMWAVKLLSCISRYDVFIFQRTTYSRALDWMIEKIHEEGKLAIFDVDDLVFDHNLIKHFPTSETELAFSMVEAIEKVLTKCDYGLTTTEYLADILRKKGKKSFVHRNCPSLDQIRISEMARAHKSSSERIKLGYFSGTNTHDYDFLEISEALIHIMEKHEQVDLYVVGFLVLSPMFKRFEGRVRKGKFVPWKKYPFEIAKVDINLAPLQDNPYCQSKSEIKYIEAALLGIPTIATPTDAFKSAIKDGENGLLASTREEWVSKLDLLILDAEKRKRIGETARQHVLTHYDPSYAGKSLLDILGQVSSSFNAK